MNSNLLEFGGSADLIATAICDFENNGTLYKKGEVILNLFNTPISFQYNTKNVSQTARRNEIYYHEYFLDSCVINTTPFNKQIQDLFSKNSQELIITKTEEGMAMGGMIFLLDEAVEDSFIKVDGVSDINLSKINEASIITSDDFIDETYYNIQYQCKKNVSCMDLDNKDLNIPYLRLQIHFKGNADKETEDSYFIIDKVSMSLTPVFSLVGNKVSHVYLMFKVIDSMNKPILAMVN